MMNKTNDSTISENFLRDLNPNLDSLPPNLDNLPLPPNLDQSQLQNLLKQDHLKVTGSGAVENNELVDVPKERTPKFKKLHKDLSQFIGGIGLSVMLFSQIDGMTVLTRTPGIVDSLVDVAEKDEKFYNFLNSLVVDSVYFNLGVQLAGLTGAILSNHNINPVDMIKNALTGKGKKKEVKTENAPQDTSSPMRVPIERETMVFDRLMN